MKSILTINNLTFSYDKISVLKDINFHVSSGKFISILGPNGSGKTTLLKNICGLLKPNEGTILLHDKEISNLNKKDFAKVISVVHQYNNIGFSFSVFDTVLMGRFPYINKFKGETKKDIKIVEEAMQNTGVWNLRNKDIREISGGERQRVMIARALVQEPELLVLDEPISNLDVKFQISILNLCKKLNEEKGLTIITTLHDINLAAQYSDSILLLDKGQIAAQGKPKNVLTPKNIEDVYEVEVEILNSEKNGFSYIIPQNIV